MTHIEVPADHPRRVSLEIREKIIEGHENQIVATAGLLAHGRGEAFDYLIGEKTTDLAHNAITAAAATMLAAERPVISINGNACALVAKYLVELSRITNASLEINLFYYRKVREDAIKSALLEAGAKEVLGTRDRASVTIPELASNRRKVDTEGIARADVVFVPLEDGDRTEALRAIGKQIITVDLNPMSRTSLFSNITIVDNIVRTLPLLVDVARELHNLPKEELLEIVSKFDNETNLAESIRAMKTHLDFFAVHKLAERESGTGNERR